MLVSYPNVRAAKELNLGFSEGFRLQYQGPRSHMLSNNLVSAEQFNTETLAKLQKEIQLGRMLGPFTCLLISTLRVSPIGLVLKSDGISWRLISHLSYPPGNSVNDYIPEEFTTVNYTSFDSILDKIYDVGRGANLGKIDIKSAFRLLIVNPADFDLLGIRFNGKFYIDKCLPMGCAVSCNLFEKFATFVQWVIESRAGLHTLDHYLDDFIFIGSEWSNDCSLLMETFMNVSNELGIPIAEDKTVGPTKVLTFLGFVIDTVLMMVLVPLEKLEKIRSILESMLHKKKVSIKELESLSGLLSYCSRAIPSSRAFIRRFYDLMASVKIKKPYYLVRVTAEVKEDILMWLQFLDNFNGQCFFPERLWTNNETLQLFTDSSGNPDLGCGAYFEGHWAQLRWPESWRNLPMMKNVTLLELVPVVLALYIWAVHLKNKKILFRIDNNALDSVINKRTSKDKQIMKLIRPLVLVTMLHNIQFKASHIEGIQNDTADALSRFQMERFRLVAPSADLLPAVIPEEF